MRRAIVPATRFLAVCIFFVLAGCNPGDDTRDNQVSDETFLQNLGAEVSRDFVGQVVDTDNHVVSGAMVTVGNASAQTDANGMFVIAGADVYQKFAYIRAAKDGYFDGSRAMVPTTGKNRVKIMLVPATPLATIESGASATVSLPDGTEVIFDGAFQDEDGHGYSGSVSVSAYHLETSNPDIDALMPGMLYGKGSDGAPKALKTYGMLNVVLRGSAGQRLNLADGHTAQISVKIDNVQAGNAPASLPLWHFDDLKGYWKEDGSAELQNGFYVGEVTHFSWWNVDFFQDPVTLTVHLVDADGNPVPGAGFHVALQDGLSSYAQQTDENGEAAEIIPAGEQVTLQVEDACGNAVYSAAAGPFSQDTQLPDIVLAGSDQPVTLHGTLLNCSGQGVSNGYVLLQYGQQNFYEPVVAGTFNFNLLMCGASASYMLTGFDSDTGQITTAVNATLLASGNNQADLIACGSIAEFAMYKIDDNAPELFLNNVTKTGGTNDAGQEMSITTPNYSQGTYETGLGEAFYGPDFEAGFESATAGQNHGFYTIIGSVSAGQWRDFYFTGFFTQDGVQHHLTITIHSNH